MKETKNTPQNPNTRGAWAERFVCRWLLQQGLTAHSSNYHRRLGEIDLILRDEAHNTWVFVEVKFRKQHARVSGIESITMHKQRRLWRTAELFLQRVNDHTSQARIDVVIVTPCATYPKREPETLDSKQTLQCATTQCSDGHFHATTHGFQLLWIQNAVH